MAVVVGLGFKYQFLFYMSIVISEGYFKHPMEGDLKKQEEKTSKIVRKKARSKELMLAEQQKKQILEDHASQQDAEGQKQSSKWSSEVIQPAIKTMSFRPKRGTRMKELIKGKHKKDQFWEKYQNYFGGDLNQPDDSDDQEDYQASSSGRDQFDSDFDLTDSYVGKRGRKKGTKVKRRKRPIAKPEPSKDDNAKPAKGKRGRKKKVQLPSEAQLKEGQLLKDEKMQCEENKPSSENNNPLQEQTGPRPETIDISSDHEERKFQADNRSNDKHNPKQDSEFKMSLPADLQIFQSLGFE